MKRIEAIVKGLSPKSKAFAAQVNSIKSAITSAKLNLEAKLEDLAVKREDALSRFSDKELPKGIVITRLLEIADEKAQTEMDIERLYDIEKDLDSDVELEEKDGE